MSGVLGLSIPKALKASVVHQAAVVPLFLNEGDLIGITSPAGFITSEGIKPALDQIKAWGYKVEIGNTIGKRDGTFGGSDFERVQDFQYMLDHPQIRAIMCARGGYGFVRIIDKLDFSKFLKQPKWIIGFSDITVLHSHLTAQFSIASIHSKMCNSFPASLDTASDLQKQTITSIQQALAGAKMQYNAPFNTSNRRGKVVGPLIGGNLRTLENMMGSASQIKTDGCILFVEDTGEYLYSVDRMFWNLKRAGMLNRLAGLIIGGFRNKEDSPGEEFKITMEQIVHQKIAGTNFPVCFDFPIGHQVNNFAVRCGMPHKLVVSEAGTTLTSI